MLTFLVGADWGRYIYIYYLFAIHIFVFVLVTTDETASGPVARNPVLQSAIAICLIFLYWTTWEIMHCESALVPGRLFIWEATAIAQWCLYPILESDDHQPIRRL